MPSWGQKRIAIVKPSFSVFYAWQSDRPGSRNRCFIQKALSEAITRLNAQASCPYVINIDQDTAGVPGLCDIPATILKKIDCADAFVCDLTYIAESIPEPGEKSRRCSNPNVLFELGYAFRVIGPERILCIMNEVYGPIASQIFDLAHRRFPIAYQMPNDDLSNKQVKAQVVESFEKALAPVIALGRRTDGGDGDRVRRVREDFEATVKDGKFHGLVRNHGVLAIAVIPGPGTVISRSDLRHDLLPPPNANGWSRESRARYIVTFSDRKLRDVSDRLRCSVSEMRIDGIMLGAETWVLDPAFHEEKELVLPAPALEGTVIAALSRYLERLRELDAPLPWTICVSVLRIRGYWLYGLFGQTDTAPFDGDDIRPDALAITSVAQPFTKAHVAMLVRPIFDFIWQEFGFETCLNYKPDGSYNAKHGM